MGMTRDWGAWLFEESCIRKLSRWEGGGFREIRGASLGTDTVTTFFNFSFCFCDDRPDQGTCTNL